MNGTPLTFSTARTDATCAFSKSAGARFALESGDDVGSVAQRRPEELDGDGPVQHKITGGDDASHAPSAEDAGDLVLAQNDVADVEGVQGASRG
jgi:hypothetical protein